MPKLLGNESVEATLEGRAKEKPSAFKYECTQSGTLEEIVTKVTQGTAAVHTYDVGIYTNSAGKPGTLLAHKTTTSKAEVTEQTITATGFSVVLTQGTSYWLAFDDKTGEPKYKYLKAAGEDLSNASASAELAEGLTWTNKVESKQPTAWGNGSLPASGYIAPITPPTFFSPRGLHKFPPASSAVAAAGEIVSGKAEGTLLLTGTSKGTAIQRVLGSATGTLLLTGTSKGLAVQKVVGVATGTLLLTGTSKGLAVQKVTGAATGTLLLTGTSKATLASVLKGNATGALLLTGTSKGITAQKITAQAAGTLLLTGTSKATVGTGVKGQATGTILLTGTAKGQTREVLLTKAQGTLFLLGTAKGTAKEVKEKRAVIFIFEE